MARGRGARHLRRSCAGRCAGATSRPWSPRSAGRVGGAPRGARWTPTSAAWPVPRCGCSSASPATRAASRDRSWCSRCSPAAAATRGSCSPPARRRPSRRTRGSSATGARCCRRATSTTRGWPSYEQARALAARRARPAAGGHRGRGAAGRTGARRELLDALDWDALLDVLARPAAGPLLGGRVLELAGPRAPASFADAVRAETAAAARAGALLELATLRVASALEAAGHPQRPAQGPAARPRPARRPRHARLARHRRAGRARRPGPPRRGARAAGLARARRRRRPGAAPRARP